MKKILPFLLIGVIIYVASVGVSFAVFRYLNKSDVSTPTASSGNKTGSGFQIDESLPKTEVCPINGQKLTKPERELWETRRPAVVMIENSTDARPQSGLSKADIVYEAVAEGGITRFMGVFYCNAASGDITLAPVRSSRIYFIDWASEYGKAPLYVHVGGANDYQNTGDTVKEARALESLEKIGWRVRGGNDFDTTFDSGFPVFWRDEDRLDHPVAIEHTMVASTLKIWEQAKKRGLLATDSSGISWSKNFSNWAFKEEAPVDKRGGITQVSFDFWSSMPGYDVKWTYDKDNNQYLRFNGGSPHQDLVTNQQLTAKNVIVMLVKEKGPVDRNKHLLYTTIGSGKAYVLQDGQSIEGSWNKTSRESRTRFFDNKGKEVSLNPGRIWIEIVPSTNQVTF